MATTFKSVLTGEKITTKKTLDEFFWSEFTARVNDIIDDPANRPEFRREMDKLYAWLNTYHPKIYAHHPNSLTLRKALESFKENVGTRAGNTIRYFGRNLTTGISAVTGKDIISSKGSDVNKISKFQKKVITKGKPVIKAVAAVGASLLGIDKLRPKSFLPETTQVQTTGTGGTGFNWVLVAVVVGVVILVLKKL